MNEDYVSFETAKLLKEKGFDEPCTVSFFDKDSYQEWIETAPRPLYVDSESAKPFTYQRPTLQMAMKWLRKEHNIHIQAFRYPAKVKRDAENSEYSKPWFYQYTFLTELEDIDTDFCGEEDFETPEEACEAAIKYCLEKLI